MERNKVGRPTKATQERMDAICAMLEIGTTRKDAANANAIDYKTFMDWLSKFSPFSLAVERSEGAVAAKMTARIYAEATKEGGDWKAAMEWLRRRRHADWGDKVQQELTGANGGAIIITEVVVEKPAPPAEA